MANMGKLPFDAIEAHYNSVMPAWMEDYQNTGNMIQDPYELDLTSYMTPIESVTWNAIRYTDLPFYPQFPVLGFFLDFANPFKKIAIECDGKQWHDKEKDKRRDAHLYYAGWTVYRIEGWKCNKVMDEPWEVFHQAKADGEPADDEIKEQYINEWMNKTCDGIVTAIGIHHFGMNLSEDIYYRLAVETLNKHRTTN